MLLLIPQRYEFSSKSQRQLVRNGVMPGCCWYHKGTNFQANHNRSWLLPWLTEVVADTTKVRIFKQITTRNSDFYPQPELLLIPQRYEFSSKSQPDVCENGLINRCCWYHKGTNFQANHNGKTTEIKELYVVADTTKVRIFKQITTSIKVMFLTTMLLLIPQRYEFSSKSQLGISQNLTTTVVADTTKVRIFKQITT